MENQWSDGEETYVSKALQLAPIGAFMADMEGKCFFVNRQWEKISGLSLEESQGTGWLKITVKEDIPAVTAVLRSAIASPEDPVSFSYRIVHPREGLRYLKVDARSVASGGGAPSYFLGYVQDITAEKNAEGRQEELNTHLQALITALEDIVLEINGHQEFLNVWVDDETKLYMPKHAFLGKKIPDVLGPQAIVFSTLAQKVLESGREDEIIYKHWDSSVDKWYKAKVKPVVKDPDPAAYIMIISISDVTQKRIAEMELIAAKNAAEEAARVKSDFLSVMSHEIRTPLNGIIGIANLLKLNHTPEQAEYISNLMFSADHLLQLVNDILDLNKIDRDEFEMNYSIVNLHDLTRNIHNQFQSLADAKKITLLSEVDPDVPKKVVADMVRLSQILNNLTSNAIHYTETGSVTLSVQLVKKQKERVVVHFSVKDTGIGIPEEYHSIIFESFRQVEQSAIRKKSGTGLGLTITQKLIGLHNSRIYLNSTPGVGTEFYFDLVFDLPTKKNKPPQRTEIPELSAYAQKFRHMRLLFVEDNPINTMVAKRQLEYFGIQPDCAASGEEALTFLQQGQYDVAFVDLHMPEMDGYTLSEIIRNDYPDIHIVIFTADIMPEVRRRFAQRGIFDVLNKPFFPREMLATLLKIAQLRKIAM